MPERASSWRGSQKRSAIDTTLAWVCRLLAYGFLVGVAVVFLKVLVGGIGALVQPSFPFVNLAFLTEGPESLYVFQLDGETRQMGEQAFRAFLAAEGLDETAVNPRLYPLASGGIGPAIAGTLFLMVGAIGLALPIALAAAVFLSEYGGSGRLVRFIRWTIFNLAGLPSIVFGLFGLSLFVRFFGWGPSLIAGSATLAAMALPTLIIAAEEALRAVPAQLREGALALGASRWETIRAIVLPRALPAFGATALMGMARLAGETAPILFTAAYAFRDRMPWEAASVSEFFTQGVMALSYHMYIGAAKSPHNEYTATMQYGTALIFLAFVVVLALASRFWRARLHPDAGLSPVGDPLV